MKKQKPHPRVRKENDAGDMAAATRVKAPDSVMMGLVAIREQNGMSQKDVSQALIDRKGGRFGCGVGRSVVTRLENGQTSPGFDHMQAYAEIFGVTVGAFFVSTHIVSRLRKGDLTNLKRYVAGLEAIIRAARELEKDGPIPTDLDQKYAFEKLFTAWLDHGVDERTNQPPSSAAE